MKSPFFAITLRQILLCVITATLGLAGQAMAETKQPPSVPREFRAAWVATVANIDWPSKRGLSTQQQLNELIAILDRAAELNLNAIIFQVRPHADALYASKLEPWSEYLTGTMGQAPEPFYDPLEMAIKEAHVRGLELHAWFNPYRALHSGSRGPLAENHVSKKLPHAVHRYGKQLWIDPGEAAAAEHSLAVILDVVKRYDVDGIHFDDYFYPYAVKDEQGNSVPFPDDRSWSQAQAAGAAFSREDWRRENVDRLIERVQSEIKQEKPWVKFGISPFGIWRPGHPSSIKGFDAYANLYADSRKWLQRGWVDYLTPQLYWKIESAGQSYPVLLRWWSEQNTKQRHLWPGNFTSRVANPDSGNWAVEEIVNQIACTRELNTATGNVHFSMKALMDDERGVAAALKNIYRQRALVPASPWLGDQIPTEPGVTRKGSTLKLVPSGKAQPWLWTIQTESADGWQTHILPGHTRLFELPTTDSSVRKIAVSGVSRNGIQGPALFFETGGIE